MRLVDQVLKNGPMFVLYFETSHFFFWGSLATDMKYGYN